VNNPSRPNQDDVLAAMHAAVDEGRRFLDESDHSMNALRDMAKTLFITACTVIPAIITLRQSVFLMSYQPIPQIAGYTRVALLIVFAIFAYCCIRAYFPENWHLPFDRDQKTIIDALYRPEEEMLVMLLAAYIEAVKNNEPIIVRRTRYVRIAMAALAVAISILLIP